MMLRAGARVIVTTRFPRDAALAVRARGGLREVEGSARGATGSICVTRRASRCSRATSRRRRTASTSSSTTPRRRCGGRRASTRTCSTSSSARSDSLPTRACSRVLARSRGVQGRDGVAIGETGHALARARPSSGDATGFVAWRGDGPGVGIRASAQLSQVPCAYDDATNDAEIFPVGPGRRRPPAGRPPRDRTAGVSRSRDVPSPGDARGAARERGRAVHPLQQAQAADAARSARARSTSSTCRRWRGSSRAARRRTSTRTRTWRRPRST